MERHGRPVEKGYVPPAPKPRPSDQTQPECRLCEEFPLFTKNGDFHRHLSEAHFRMELNNELPQVIFLIHFLGGGGYEKNYNKMIFNLKNAIHDCQTSHFNLYLIVFLSHSPCKVIEPLSQTLISNPLIFATRCRKPLILSLKYQRFTQSYENNKKGQNVIILCDINSLFNLSSVILVCLQLKQYVSAQCKTYLFI